MLARRRGNAAVERHGDFHPDERALVLDPAGEAFVDAAGFGLADAERDLDAGGAQAIGAVSRDIGIGIDGGGDDALDAGGDQGFRAGAGAAGVVAGLEGDVGGGAAEAFFRVLLACLRAARFRRGREGRTRATLRRSRWPALSRITQPTAGFGEVRAMPRRASSRARCIQ